MCNYHKSPKEIKEILQSLPFVRNVYYKRNRYGEEKEGLKGCSTTWFIDHCGGDIIIATILYEYKAMIELLDGTYSVDINYCGFNTSVRWVKLLDIDIGG